MLNTHTPGPWAIEAAPNGYTYIRAEHRAEIALVGSENMLADDSSAASNAMLIAAAPDLLEALRDLVEAVEDPEASSLMRLNAARDAIAKATGA